MIAQGTQTRHTVPRTADFAIVTVIPEQFDAVKRVLDLRGSDIRNGLPYCFGRVPSMVTSGNHFIVCTRCPDRSNIPAATHTKDVVKTWTPQALLLVDIAGGVHGRDDVNPGDIVVSSAVKYYEFQKLVDGKQKPRSFETEPPAPYLVAPAESVRTRTDLLWLDWIEEERPELLELSPKVLLGETLSGDKLVGDPDSELLKELLAQHEKAVAVDMESGGLAQAIYIFTAQQLMPHYPG